MYTYLSSYAKEVREGVNKCPLVLEHYMSYWFFCRLSNTNISVWTIQSIPGGKVNILGGHSICLSKQNLYM
jgi:hypothetical protein